MPAFGARSSEQLQTIDPRLQRVFLRVIEIFDFSVVEGHRGEEAQNVAVAKGLSQVPWPLGKHNSKPSKAGDCAPYPLDWGGAEPSLAMMQAAPAEALRVMRKNEAARQRFCLLAGMVIMAGYEQGVVIRWGGDWDSDRDTRDERFRDLPHFEIDEEATAALGRG